MPRIIKKQAEKKASKEVPETLVDIKERLHKQQKMLIISVVVFLLIVGSVVGYIFYNKSAENKAKMLEYEGYKIFYGQFQAIPDPSSDRYKKALEKFKESYNTKKNPNVLFYIANCHYEIGDYDEVINNLKELINRFKEPHIVSYAYYKMAMTYLKKNDIENALNTLSTLSKYKEGVLQDMALMESASILDVTGKKEDAKVKYKELIEKYPHSPFINEAKLRIGEK